MDRVGKLELRKFGTVPVTEVERKHRFSSSFSDFITRYTAVSSTNKRTEIAEYYALDPDDGLTMNLGVNPLLQFGLVETREQLCRNILDDISVIRYVPFDSETIGNPALDLGDVLTFSGGQADAREISAITSMELRLYGKQKLKGVGKNPWLARAKSKNDKNISGLISQIEGSKASGRIGIHTFTNASAYSVGEVETKIIQVEFAASEETVMQFFGQVIVDVVADPVTKSGNVMIQAAELKNLLDKVAAGSAAGKSGSSSSVAGDNSGSSSGSSSSGSSASGSGASENIECTGICLEVRFGNPGL